MPPIDTPSGRPEVMIHRVTKKAVADTLVSRTLEKGWQMKTANDYQLIFEQVAGGAVGFLLGSEYDPTVRTRLTYVLVDQGPAVHVTARIEYVTNPGSAFELITDVTTGQLGHNVQDALEQTRNLLEIARP